MHKKVTVFLIFLFLALPITAMAVKPETTILVWYSFRTNTNFAFFEGYETRGKWIAPDVGWFDFGKPWNYREVFAGGGYIPVKNDKITFAAEGLFLQGTGVSGNRPNFFLPFLSSEIKISKKLSWNTAYFGRVPLNDTAYGSHSLDRSKLLWRSVIILPLAVVMPVTKLMAMFGKVNRLFPPNFLLPIMVISKYGFRDFPIFTQFNYDLIKTAKK